MDSQAFSQEGDCWLFSGGIQEEDNYIILYSKKLEQYTCLNDVLLKINPPICEIFTVNSHIS
jgi:hypothetical protein